VRRLPDILLERVRPDLPSPIGLAKKLMCCLELVTDVTVFAVCSPQAKASEILALHYAVEKHRPKSAKVQELSHMLTTTSKMIALAYAQDAQVKVQGNEREVLSAAGETLLRSPVATRPEDKHSNGQARKISLAELGSHMAEAVALIQQDENHEHAHALFTKAMGMVSQSSSLQLDLSTHFSSLVQTQSKEIVAGVAVGYILGGGGGLLATLLVGWACSQSTDGCIAAILAALLS
jgi:hypothetical protein